MSKIKSKARECAVVSETGDVCWDALMRKFVEANKEKCKSLQLEVPRAERALKELPTGSTYEGTWNVLGISGYGYYQFPHGPVYEGDFEDGEFEGEGELLYKQDLGEIITLRGHFKKGQMTNRKLIFAEGLEYAETNWKYCQPPDRRFSIEYEEGLSPAGDSVLTAVEPSPVVAPNHFDTGDGFFSTDDKAVYAYKQPPKSITRVPAMKEQKWIVNNCRTSVDAISHIPRPGLYDKWLEPELELEPMPWPAARMEGLDDLMLMDWDKRESQKSIVSQMEDFDDPSWRRDNRRRSTAGSTRFRKSVFYKTSDTAMDRRQSCAANRRQSSIHQRPSTA